MSLLYFYLQDHSTEVLHYDQFMYQQVNVFVLLFRFMYPFYESVLWLVGALPVCQKYEGIFENILKFFASNLNFDKCIVRT